MSPGAFGSFMAVVFVALLAWNVSIEAERDVANARNWCAKVGPNCMVFSCSGSGFCTVARDGKRSFKLRCNEQGCVWP